MLKRIDWDHQIGRRLRLRDLHVFFTVAHAMGHTELKTFGKADLCEGGVLNLG